MNQQGIPPLSPGPRPAPRAGRDRRLLHSRAGATAIEYGLILALIAISILGALTTFSESGTKLFNTAAENISTAITR